MLNAGLVTLFASGLVGQTYPDQLDILRGADVRPQIELVLDTSLSMNQGVVSTPCAAFAQTVNRLPNAIGGYELNRMEMVKAVLTGCINPSDGILDQWGTRVLFAIRRYPDPNALDFVSVNGVQFESYIRSQLVWPFPADGNVSAPDVNTMEGLVRGLVEEGGTPMAQAYYDAALNLRASLNASNSAQCRQTYIVMMTDGDGNRAHRRNHYANSTGPLNFNFIPGQAPLEVADPYGCYTSPDPNCGDRSASPYLDEAARYLRVNANDQPVDALPQVPGTQPVRTHTIAFNAPADAEALLYEMAEEGDGRFFDADNYQNLSDAFRDIILSVVGRSNVALSAASVQNAGLFSGNYTYATSFRPVDNGPWLGNVKKFCVMPRTARDTTCIFRYDATGRNLITNPTPRDIWTGIAGNRADQAGAGQRMLTELYGVTDPRDPVPANPLGRRTLLTWRPGQRRYVRLGVDRWDTADSWTNSDCDHWSLLNKLHGYEYGVADCGRRDYTPARLDLWPLGDTVNGGAVLLKYTDSCENAGDRCYLAVTANDGMVHFINAVTGVETSAVVPGDLWGPSLVQHSLIEQLMDQPSDDSLRRFYLDGKIRLYHEELDNDGVIDPNETAYLIAGLGRGGRQYIQWNVTRFGGVPTDGDNPPRPLSVDEATAFRDLRDTWAAPWLGRMTDPAGATRDVAVFPSGHQRELDRPNVGFATLSPGLPPAPDFSNSSRVSQGCNAVGIDPLLCNPPAPIQTNGCTPCTALLPCPLNPGTSSYCYDWPGWRAILPPPFNALGSSGVTFGPYSYSTPQYEGIGYRVVFSSFDLQPNDSVIVLDSAGVEIGRLTGPQPPGEVALPWVLDRSFRIRVETDGVDTVSATGFNVQRIEVMRRDIQPTAGVVTRPQLYVVDVDRWNGTGNTADQTFAAPPILTNDRQGSSLVARITSDCDGLDDGELCVDAAGSDGALPQPDLAHMVCPVSAEPAVYTEGGLFRAAYYGDECGQLWKAERTLDGAWRVRRLLHLNNVNGGGSTIPGRASKDYRKIFTKVELVLSKCNGQRSVGVYFGSGNLQRPALLDNLADRAVTDGPGQTDGRADVIGVVWDSAALTPNAGLEDLFNATLVTRIADPRSGAAVNGYYIELLPNEKMLRDPVVLDGVAYFKTYQPITQASECVAAAGQEFIFAFDNCSAAPIADGNANGAVGDSVGDRVVMQTVSDIGSNLMVYTPVRGAAFVSPGAQGSRVAAQLPGRPNRRALKLFLWRTELESVF